MAETNDPNDGDGPAHEPLPPGTGETTPSDASPTGLPAPGEGPKLQPEHEDSLDALSDLAISRVISAIRSSGGTDEDGLEETREVEAMAAGPRPSNDAADLTLSDRYQVGDRLDGRFELVRRLGRGAFGRVWEAVDLKLERKVAIKIPARFDGDPTQRERFLAEARAAAKLRHEAIVSVLEVCETTRPPTTTDGVPRQPFVGPTEQIYIVAERIDGPTLKMELDDAAPEPPFGIDDSIALVCRLAQAVEHAHRNEVVHRDIKPANILLDEEGVYLTDFGMARSIRSVTADEVQMLAGTPAYMAPEQTGLTDARIGPRADVYALGVLLYELLTGVQPFVGEVQQVLYRVAHTPPVPIRELKPHVPRDLELVVMTCLEKLPGDRLGSAGELADELERIAAGKPIRTRPPGWIDRAMKCVRRNPLVSAISAGLVVALLAGTVGVALQWHRAEEALIRSEREHRAAIAAERAARVARAEADRQADLAGQRLGEAQDLVGSLLENVDEQLSELPGAKRARQELLDQIGQTLASIAESSGDAETKQLQIERNMKRGEMAQQYGAYDAAEVSYRQAIEGLQSRLAEARRMDRTATAADDEPIEPIEPIERQPSEHEPGERVEPSEGVDPDEVLSRLFAAMMTYADTLRRIGRVQQSVDVIREAERLILMQAEQQGRQPRLIDQYAVTHHLARSYERLGRMDAAYRTRREALQYAEKLAERFAHLPKARLRLALAKQVFALRQLDVDGAAAARDTAGEAIAIYREFADDPTAANGWTPPHHLKRERAASLRVRATASVRLCKFVDALRDLREAAKISLEYERDHPMNEHGRSEMIADFRSLADLQLRLGNVTEAARSLKVAEDRSRDNVAVFPEDERSRTHLVDTLLVKSILLLRQTAADDAVATSEEGVLLSLAFQESDAAREQILELLGPTTATVPKELLRPLRGESSLARREAAASSAASSAAPSVASPVVATASGSGSQSDAEDGDDVRLSPMTTRSLFLLGRCDFFARRSDDDPAIERSIRLFRYLDTRPAKTPVTSHGAFFQESGIRLRLSVALATHGDHEAAIALVRRVLASVDAAARARPDDLMLTQFRGYTRVQASGIFVLAGRIDEARRLARESLNVFDYVAHRSDYRSFVSLFESRMYDAFPPDEGPRTVLGSPPEPEWRRSLSSSLLGERSVPEMLRRAWRSDHPERPPLQFVDPQYGKR